jgi:hypothetical protein
MRKNSESKGFTESEKKSSQLKKATSNKLKSLIKGQKIEAGYKKVNYDELMNPYRELLKANPKAKKEMQKLLYKTKEIINKKSNVKNNKR